ncbi:MAG: hypothetical protein WD490_03255 [Opitutales bacterium]
MFIIFYIILGVALLFTFANRKDNEDKAKISVMVIAAVAIIGAISQIFVNVGGAGGGADGRLDDNVNAAIGQVAAERFASTMNSGDDIVVIANVVGAYVSPAVQARHDAFVEHAQLNGLNVLGSISPFGRDPQPEDMGSAGMGVPVPAVRRAMEEFPSARGVVSLEGLPMANIRNISGFSSGDTKYYAIVEFAPYDWRPMLRDGLLGGIIVYHSAPDWNATRGTPEELFDKRFVHVTQDNFTLVSDRLPPFR